MSTLVFQATLGGQINLNGANTASSFDIAVPATTGTMVTTGDSGTVTNTMLAASAYNTPGTIGSGTANSGAFTTLSASSTVSGTGFSTYLASPPAIGGTTAASGRFSSLTNTGLTSGRVVYSTTSGLETDSANLLYSGTDLTVYGLTVGRGTNAIATNTAFGTNALSGANAGAGRNTAIGYLAGVANTSGTGLTALGAYALTANTTGTSNTGVGGNDGSVSAALQANTTGSQNTAVGTSALASNTTGGNNTAQGYQALYSNTTASSNTAVGYQAGYSNTSGAVTAFGNQALYANTTAGGNAAFGDRALVANTTGNSNLAVGTIALYTNITGSQNTAIGYSAGTLATGTGNTLLGYNSGSAITTGAKNTIIGAYTGSAAPISATGSNFIVLSDGDGNVRQYGDSTGNMYIAAGNLWVYAPAPTAPSAAVTLTAAQLATDIINTTGTTYTVTLPLASAIDTAYPAAGTSMGLDFHIVNTATGVITIAVNTGITSVGLLTVSAATSAHFRLRRTAAATYILYRLS